MDNDIKIGALQDQLDKITAQTEAVKEGLKELKDDEEQGEEQPEGLQSDQPKTEQKGEKKKEEVKHLTLNDRFELFHNGVRPENLPRDEHGVYNCDPKLCGATSPMMEFPCTAGLEHQQPHVSASQGTVLAVWDEPV